MQLPRHSLNAHRSHPPFVCVCVCGHMMPSLTTVFLIYQPDDQRSPEGFNSFPGLWRPPNYRNPPDTWTSLRFSPDAGTAERMCRVFFFLSPSSSFGWEVGKETEVHSDRLVGLKCWYAAMLADVIVCAGRSREVCASLL